MTFSLEPASTSWVGLSRSLDASLKERRKIDPGIPMAIRSWTNQKHGTV